MLLLRDRHTLTVERYDLVASPHICKPNDLTKLGRLNSGGDKADCLSGIFIIEFSAAPGSRNITEPKCLKASIYVPAIADTNDDFLASEAILLLVD